MDFSVLKPKAKTYDPRMTEFESSAQFDLHFDEGLTENFGLESAALKRVREDFPEMVAMPFPVKIGSGTVFVMGIIANATEAVQAQDSLNSGTAHDLPFVLIVRASAESSLERGRMKKDGIHVYNRAMWSTPVVERPTGATAIVPMTLRAKAPDFPKVVDAVIGMSAGRVAFWAEWAPGESAVWLVDRAALAEALRKIDAMEAASGVRPSR